MWTPVLRSSRNHDGGRALAAGALASREGKSGRSVRVGTMMGAPVNLAACHTLPRE